MKGIATQTMRHMAELAPSQAGRRMEVTRMSRSEGEETIGEERRNKQATREMFNVKRDGEGNVIPVTKEIEWEDGYYDVDVRPMAYGDIEAWNAKSRKKQGIDAFEIAATLKRHIVDPDFGDMTEQRLRKDLKAMAVNALLMAILGASGMKGKVTVGDDMTATIELEGDEENE